MSMKNPRNRASARLPPSRTTAGSRTYDENPGLRHARHPLPDVPDPGRLGRDESERRLLGGRAGGAHRRPRRPGRACARLHARPGERHPARRGARAGALPGRPRRRRDDCRPGRAVPRASRRQPAALAGPRAGRHAHGDRRGAERLLGSCRPAGGETTLAAALRPDPGADRRPGRLPLPDGRDDPRDALELLERSAAGKAERTEILRRDGYPAYATSPGWLGYSDERMAELCAAAVRRASPWSSSRSAPGWKTTCGAAPSRARWSARMSASRWTRIRSGTCRPPSRGSARWRRSRRCGSRSRRARTTSWARPRSTAASARSGSPPASTSPTG